MIDSLLKFKQKAIAQVFFPAMQKQLLCWLFINIIRRPLIWHHTQRFYNV